MCYQECIVDELKPVEAGDRRTHKGGCWEIGVEGGVDYGDLDRRLGEGNVYCGHFGGSVGSM